MKTIFAQLDGEKLHKKLGLVPSKKFCQLQGEENKNIQAPMERK